MDNYRFCYLSLVLDAYNEEIIGWSVEPTIGKRYPLEALKMAIGRIRDKSANSLIHHSDRGCLYASREYVSIIDSNGIRISMVESGDPKENAQAERINNRIKNEIFKGRHFSDINEVRHAVKNAVDFYNNERPHMSINMLTPAEAADNSGDLEKRWTSYRLIVIKSKLQDINITRNSLPLQSGTDDIRQVSPTQ